MGLFKFCFLLLFLASTSARSQVIDSASSGLPRSFHDDALNITYFYPTPFTAVEDPPVPGASKCAQNVLTTNAINRIGSSSFTVSRLDTTCVGTPGDVNALPSFVRGQIWSQLREYGTPTITREPLRYIVSGRPAYISMASVSFPHGKTTETTYAAKACALSVIPDRRHKKSDPVDPNGHILCFDFTTDNADLVSSMLSFVIQFANDPPEPLFLASAQPKH